MSDEKFTLIHIGGFSNIEDIELLLHPEKKVKNKIENMTEEEIEKGKKAKERAAEKLKSGKPW